MKIDRDKLRQALRSGGPTEFIRQARLMGLRREETAMGNRMLVTADGSDAVHCPTWSMRQADAVDRDWHKLAPMY